jgi:hypothetical protein
VFGKAFKATFGVGCAIVVAIIAIALIGGALASKSVSGPTATTTPPFAAGTAAPVVPAAPAVGTKNWVVIKEWSGNGAKDTETFTVGSEWRVDWVNSGSYLGVTIYDAATKFPVGLAANTQAQTSDTSFQHKAGTYYLSVNAIGGWKVAVQDMR